MGFPSLRLFPPAIVATADAHLPVRGRASVAQLPAVGEGGPRGFRRPVRPSLQSQARHGRRLRGRGADVALLAELGHAETAVFSLGWRILRFRKITLFTNEICTFNKSTVISFSLRLSALFLKRQIFSPAQNLSNVRVFSDVATFLKLICVYYALCLL